MRNEIDLKIFNKVNSLLEKDPDNLCTGYHVSLFYLYDSSNGSGYKIELSRELTKDTEVETTYKCLPEEFSVPDFNQLYSSNTTKLSVCLTTPSFARYIVKASPSELDALIEKIQIKIKNYLSKELD